MREAEKLLEEMRDKNVERDVVAYNTIIGGFCKIGDIGRVYKDMIRKTFRPESSTIEALIGGLCDKRRISEAMEILRVGVEKFSLSPTKNSYMFLIKGLCEDGNMEEALKVQAEWWGKGLSLVWRYIMPLLMDIWNKEMVKWRKF
ncbi:hypothetical protein LWI28_007282 [Acer negundo]|uniref:Pentatricopeptide repeat-containing protein n=1 Tax=Acer negundo TaxID=4023 RepID=A0AAD5J992_ACENE|nr:hypothetical protein LWI28_007282 [Acer negundo]